MMCSHKTVIRRLASGDEAALGKLFEAINLDQTAARFRPHPFTAEQANVVANYAGRDDYFGAWVATQLCGYGMLRGLDAGYAIPSLGIYVAPGARGTGLSTRLMDAMHAAARDSGADKIRLRVLQNNVQARRLYEKCGYRFDGTVDSGELVGIKIVNEHRGSSSTAT